MAVPYHQCTSQILFFLCVATFTYHVRMSKKLIRCCFFHTFLAVVTCGIIETMQYIIVVLTINL